MRDKHRAVILSRHDMKELKKAKRLEDVNAVKKEKHRSRRVKKLAMLGVFIGIILAAGYFLTNQSESSSFTPITNGGHTGLATGNANAGDPFLGDENAPVTIIEYSDFECPFCNRFFHTTEPLIKSQYIDTGRVKFVYKDFPVAATHPNAQKAAEAAQCAFDQGKFWEYHDILFANAYDGDRFSQLGGSRAAELFKKYASNIGLNTNAFGSCFDSGAKRSVVLADMQEGQRAGVRGTPSFLINGRLVVGAQPFSSFVQIIESELSQ